jgi:hypothetical protein
MALSKQSRLVASPAPNAIYSRITNLAHPVDYRKSRGSKGVHTEDEQLPIGKQDQARGATSSEGQKAFPNTGDEKPTGKGKHSAGHAGQKPQRGSN